MEQKVNILYLCLIPILVVGISFGYTTFPICLALLILRLAITDRYTAGFYLIMYGGLIGGVIRTIYPSIPVYGLLLNLLGLVLTFDKLSQFLLKGKKSLAYLFFLYFFFSVYYFIGPRDAFATTKLSNIIQQGMFTILGYYLFCSTSKINNESILQIIFLSTLLMFAFVIKYYHFTAGSLFNYEWFRNYEYSYLASNNFEGGTLVSYQHIAMNMLYGLAIYLSSKKISKVEGILYVLCASQLILTSGCRQAILGLFLVILLRLTVYREMASSRTIPKVLVTSFITIVLLIASYQFITFLNIDFINNTLKEGDIGRNALLLQGIEIFANKPILGAGLGGFHAITDEVYPHNFIVETLCECGIVGLLVFSLLIIKCIRHSKLSIRYSTSNNSYLFLILSALLVRILVSGDFSISIELFSALFATLAITNTSSSQYKSRLA